ncbi:MAG: N-acetylmuramoyl-L-alanine amidase [Nitrospinota bacterium]
MNRQFTHRGIYIAVLTFIFFFAGFTIDPTICLERVDAFGKSAKGSTESLYQDARKSYYRLLASSKLMSKRVEWEKAIKKFEKVHQRYPKSNRGRDALYTIGLLYKRLAQWSGYDKDNESAILYFNKVIKKFPQSGLVDDSKRNIGDIRFRQKKYDKAEAAYRAPSKSKSSKKRGDSGKQSLAHLSALKSIKEYNKSGYARIILELTKQTAFNDVSIRNPDRLYIDLLNTYIPPSLIENKSVSLGVVKSIRASQNKKSVSRVVFDIDANKYYHKVTALKNPFRIVIDIGGEKSANRRIQSDERALRTRAPSDRSIAKLAKTNRAEVIVVDAGHGGRDPGAVSKSGLKEKDITLKLARIVAKKLKQKTNYKIVFTRDSDKYIALDERTILANSLDAKLFISIHINASKKPRANGFETYFLSPARSEDELDTAARENMLSLRSSNELENDLAYILTDLSNTQKVNDSYRFATLVQSSTVKSVQRKTKLFKDNGVKQAMFYLLWRANMPAILVEAGYISNKKEEAALRSNKNLKLLGESIADGVLKFLKDDLIAMR